MEEANKSRANLEKLLDQQQQLTLISNRKIEALKLELEKKEESEIEKNEETVKNKWWKFWS